MSSINFLSIKYYDIMNTVITRIFINYKYRINMKTKILIMILFISLTLLILILANYLVYAFIIKFFSITDGRTIFILRIFFLILSFSFIFSSLLVHFYSDVFTRFLYFASGLWYGVLLNLLLGIATVWLIRLLLKIININLSLVTLGVIALSFGLFISIYGLINAYSLSVKEFSLSSDKLPDSWRGRTAVFISDAHLGNVLGNDYLRRINKEIQNIKPDFVFIAGDFFDGVDGIINTFLPVLREISAPLGVYYVTGNHETYLGEDKVIKLLEQTNIQVLDNKLLDIDGAQIIGLAFPKRMERFDMTGSLDILENYDKEKFSILLYHEPRQIASAQKAGIDLMLCGHTHRGQLWPLNYITNLVYKGYDYGLIKNDDFSIYISSGVGVWGTTMRTSGRNEIVKINFK